MIRLNGIFKNSAKRKMNPNLKKIIIIIMYLQRQLV